MKKNEKLKAYISFWTDMCQSIIAFNKKNRPKTEAQYNRMLPRTRKYKAFEE